MFLGISARKDAVRKIVFICERNGINYNTPGLLEKVLDIINSLDETCVLSQSTKRSYAKTVIDILKAKKKEKSRVKTLNF